MSDHQNTEETDLERRALLKTAGAAMIAGWADSATLAPTAAAQETRTISAAARNSGPLSARLQGVQHFGVTMQNMDRAYGLGRHTSLPATRTDRLNVCTKGAKQFELSNQRQITWRRAGLRGVWQRGGGG